MPGGGTLSACGWDSTCPGHLHIDSVRVSLEVSTAFIDTLSYTCNQIARIAHGTDGRGLQILPADEIGE